jgi:hypothetical protein
VNPRILAAALALVALSGLTACNPRQLGCHYYNLATGEVSCEVTRTPGGDAGIVHPKVRP